MSRRFVKKIVEEFVVFGCIICYSYLERFLNVEVFEKVGFE